MRFPALSPFWSARFITSLTRYLLPTPRISALTFRCGERKQLLYGICHESIPHLPVHDDICLCEKGLLYFPAGDGKSGGVHHASMVREIVFGVGFALLLPVMFGLDGILYSMPVSDILTFVIAVFL